MTNPTGIDRTGVCGAISASLKGLVGQGKRWSIEQLSRDTGIPSQLLKAYRRGSCAPGATNLARLVKVLGGEFANQYLSLAGMGGAHGISSVPCAYKANEAASGFVNEVALALSDDVSPGRIDHLEEPAIREAAARAAPVLVAYVGSRS